MTHAFQNAGAGTFFPAHHSGTPLPSSTSSDSLLCWNITLHRLVFSQAGVSWFHSANELALAPSLGTWVLLPPPDSAWEMLRIIYCILFKKTQPNNSHLEQPGSTQERLKLTAEGSQGDSMKKTPSAREPMRRRCWYKNRVTRTRREQYIFQRRGWRHPAKGTGTVCLQTLLWLLVEKFMGWVWLKF